MTLAVDHVKKGILTAARKLREDLHRHPELAFREERTAGVIARELREAGLDDVRTGVAGTGVVALLRGGRPGRCIALRADIDALPIQEESEAPYASVNAGVMHACGHDGHTAILLSVAACSPACATTCPARSSSSSSRPRRARRAASAWPRRA